VAIKLVCSTRDVYVDNELDHGDAVLTADAPSRLALISARLEFRSRASMSPTIP